MRIVSEETRRKLSLANRGRVFSEEWRRNLSISHKGQISHRKGKIVVDKETQNERRRIRVRLWKQRNQERLTEQARTWRSKNKQRLAMLARLRYHNNNQKELDRIRKKKYGISGEEFRAMLSKQGGKCPICTRDISKNLSVDHSHITGKIRGLICNNCNLAIGNSNDSPERLRAMADYLEQNA